MFVSSASKDVSLPEISVTVTAALALSTDNFVNFDTTSLPFRRDTSAVPALDTPTITNIVLNALEGVQSGVPTRTTSTLTPTRLRNIEQIFELHLSAPESHSNQAGFVPPPAQTQGTSSFVSVDSRAWAGGTTTFRSDRSGGSSPSSCSSVLSSSPPLTVATMPSLTITGGVRRMGGRRPLRDDKVSPEEADRRNMRRERNKQAAARCRKRRLDQTTTLQDETEGLEDKRSSLQQEISLLQQQKDELEFLLAAHNSTCKKNISRSSNVLSSVEYDKRDNRLILSSSQSFNPDSLAIKVEVDDSDNEMDTHVDVEPELKPSRPTFLSLNMNRARKQLPPDLGITIETPSSGMRGMGLNFESMMEGGTGLTPIATVVPSISSGLTPLSTPVVTSLNTPIVTSTSSSNCGIQLRSTSAELSPESVAHKLVSL